MNHESQNKLEQFNTWEKLKIILDIVHRDQDISILVFSPLSGLVYSDITAEESPIPYEKLLHKITGEVKLMEVLKERTRKAYLGVCDEDGCHAKKILETGQGTLKKRFTFYYECIEIDQERLYVIKIKDTTTLLEYEQNLLDLNYQLNQQVRQVNDSRIRLAQQDRLVAIGHLASGIAHEINNPLSFVKSNFEVMSEYVENLMKAYEDILQNLMTLEQINFHLTSPEINDCIQYMKQSIVEHQIKYISDDYQMLITDTQEGIGRVENIVDNLKQFSKLDHHINLDNYEINQGILFATQMMQSRLNKGIDLIKDVQFVPLTLAYGAELNQAILNILTNAVDAVEAVGESEGGVVKITTRSDQKYIYLEIMDNGIGIPEKFQDQIYDPFFTTKNNGKTVGLGLSIAYDVIVNKHDGELYFESMEGQGTTFFIKLPVKHVESATIDEFINYY